jgi:DNA-binding FadR family transcriptional regulator
LKRLKDMDLVQRRAGSGTYVNYTAQPDHQHVAESTSPLELIEVRLAVEPVIARLAVVNANPRNLRQVHAALVTLEQAGDNPDAFSKADELFHLSLARCSQNSLMEWIYQMINEVRGHHQWDVRKNQLLRAKNIREYNAQHWALYESIPAKGLKASGRDHHGTPEQGEV